MNDRMEYWLELCDDDLITAKWLLKGKRLLHCGYFCHQVLEKAFKAAISKKTNEVPPKIHDLPKLAQKGHVWEIMSGKHTQTVQKAVSFQIEARYPEFKEKIAQTLTYEYCASLIDETEDLLCWIKQQLGK